MSKMGLINIYPSSVHLERQYQRQKSAARHASVASQGASPAATPKQLRQSHSATASAGLDSAELEGSIGHQGIKPRATEIKEFKMSPSLSK